MSVGIFYLGKINDYLVYTLYTDKRESLKY